MPLGREAYPGCEVVYVEGVKVDEEDADGMEWLMGETPRDIVHR